MTGDGMLHQPRLRGRFARLGGTLALACLAWFAVAFSASAESPSPSAAPVDAPSPSSSPAVSTPAAPTPRPSDTDWMYATPVPSQTAPPATAPPVPERIAHPDGGGENGCYDCHSAVNAKQAEIASDWKDSVHGQGEVTCADCHGGDPGSDQITKAMDPEIGFKGAPDRPATVGLCGSCHANVDTMKASGLPTDQYAKYWSSVHGQQLITNDDARVAVCTDCHGVHDIKKVSDPTAKTFALNVPDAVRKLPRGRAADAAVWHPHGPVRRLLQERPRSRAAGQQGRPCPVLRVLPRVSRRPAADVGDGGGGVWQVPHRHAGPVHGEPALGAPDRGPQVLDLPRNPRRGQAELQALLPSPAPEYTCVTCHDLQTHTLRLEISQFDDPDNRRCDTCHHPESQIYSQIEGISNAVVSAEEAYVDAEDEIQKAAGLGMITSDAEVALAGAKTSLIQAQAAVHTTKLTSIAELSADAVTKSEEARALATAKIDETDFRRSAMVVVLGFILLGVAWLWLTKRRLDRELERDLEARSHE